MKTKVGILVLALGISNFNCQAQQRVTTTTRATSYDISDNLDLDAVSSIFAESKDLSDFEYRLNDPDNRISNLDLNRDGYVDYLRVVETTNDRNSLVVVQAVLDKDVFQDVATIEIERVPDGRHRIQVVGNAWIYGPDYIIEPVFVRTPLIFSFFWGPRYIAWSSPFYWGHYPRWFYYYKPYPTHRYHRHVNIYVDRRVTFNRVNERHFRVNDDRFNSIRRNDFADRHPDRSFENRHRGSTPHDRQIQRSPSRPSGNQPGRRIENGNNNRSNENIRRDMNQNRENQNRRQIYQQRQNNNQQREIQKSGEIQKSRENNQSNQLQQRNQSNEQQRTIQTRPEVREKLRQRTDNAPRERSGSIQEKARTRSEVKQKSQNVQKSEPKKEEKKESRERRRGN